MLIISTVPSKSLNSLCNQALLTLGLQINVPGAILSNEGLIEESIPYFERAFAGYTPKKLGVYSNYIGALRLAGFLDLAHNNAEKVLQFVGDISFSKDDAPFFQQYALVENDRGNAELAIRLAEKAVNLDLPTTKYWRSLIDILNNFHDFETAERLAVQYTREYGRDPGILLVMGIAVHHQRRLEDAVRIYKLAEELSPNMNILQANIAAAYQELGWVGEAYLYYSKVIPSLPYDASIRNNFGALLGAMGRHDEELYWLNEALRLDPTMSHALVNLAGHYQDNGQLDKAEELLLEIKPTSPDYRHVSVRLAQMISPIADSWHHMTQERCRMRDRLLAIINRSYTKGIVDNTVDRIHFYISFHGLNDRPLQELVGRAYAHCFSDVSTYGRAMLQGDQLIQRYLREEHHPVAIANSRQVVAPYPRRLRVGFISKFFGIFEPHGMLLDGTMQYLPRDQFEVVCLCVARTDFKPVSPRIEGACNELHELSLSSQHVIEKLHSIALDVLIFADVLSEPINHYQAHSRVAPIQIGFWGNPITTGSPTMDYYISADVMETPYRTRLQSGDDAYSEQVLLLEGQGIWYFPPIDPDVEIARVNMTGLVGKKQDYTRADFNLPQDCFLYLLPQSTFKIHPLYDLVLREILEGNPRIHLAVTAGRRPAWTKRYVDRLARSLGPAGLLPRLHVIERVSSENFYSLLSLADAVLHPFPFDGSRTSADALQMHIPLVTLPTEYLRGRMGYSLLRTLNLPELVAVDVQDYIDIAVRLSLDPAFLARTKEAIVERIDLLWEDMTVPHEITNVLQRACGLQQSSYRAFLQQTGRGSVDLDLERTRIRTANGAAFDRAYQRRSLQRRELVGETSSWHLDADGRLPLEAFIEGDRSDAHWPRVFQHWREQRLRAGNPIRYSSPATSTSLKSSDGALEKRPQPSLASSASSMLLSKAADATSPQRILQQEQATAARENASTPSSQLGIRSHATSSPVLDIKVTSVKTASIPLPSSSTDSVTLDVSVTSERLLQLFRRALQHGDYETAQECTSRLLSMPGVRERLHQDAVFMLELGTMHFFRGQHRDALLECTQARTLDPLLINAYGCMGVASLYLPEPAMRKAATKHLLQAFVMKRSALLAAYTRLVVNPQISDNDTNGNRSVNIASRDITLAQLMDFLRTVNEDEVTGEVSVTTIPFESCVFNLFAALVVNEEYDTCADVAADYLSLPPYELGGSHVIAMANIEWSEVGWDEIRRFQTNFMESRQIVSSPATSWPALIQYVQTYANTLVNNFGLCLTLSPRYKAQYGAALRDVNIIIERVHQRVSILPSGLLVPSLPSAAMKEAIVTKPSAPLIVRKLILVTQYFRHLDSRVQAELDYVLLRNLANPVIDEVHVLTEIALDLTVLPNKNNSNQAQVYAHKLHQYVLGHRLTFFDAFRYANTFLSGHVVILGMDHEILSLSMTRSSSCYSLFSTHSQCRYFLRRKSPATALCYGRPTTRSYQGETLLGSLPGECDHGAVEMAGRWFGRYQFGSTYRQSRCLDFPSSTVRFCAEA